MAVGEKTECVGNFDKIVESTGRNIQLTDENDTHFYATLEFTFHHHECCRLMITNHFNLLITSQKTHKKRHDQPNERSHAQVKTSLGRIESSQRIKCSHGRNHKRAGHKRRHLIMSEL